MKHLDDGISLKQQHFIESVLDLCKLSECKQVSTPLTAKDHLEPEADLKIKELHKLRINYRSTIGSIRFLITATRPDLLFAVSALSQHLEKPGIKHWKEFKHVSRYLLGMQEIGPHYTRSNKKGVKAFSKANRGNGRITRRSVTEYITCLHNNLVIWKTNEQPSVYISTAEAEYKALCDLTSELLWLKQWCKEEQIFKITNPITIYEYNQSLIKVENGDSNINNKRMKHIDIQSHSVKE
ncbi:hypothetical protein O181_079491 [Austropuccinia psidii MF-1]|uniref:Reverse transcriptase Ty1/copia-type domain-containing protein n=1 Tax=Austropuccinia psidii MF-1 TaxID=1389203 RepID=A0A9Q3FGD0_9BASI|nr:hypothetical protein [Austropuccinia psidii MF-1]